MYTCQKNGDLIIKIYIQPSAKKNAIIGLHGENLKIKIKAPPVDDKANRELISFLADYLHVPQNTIEIVNGQHSRNKLVRLKNAGVAIENILLNLMMKQQ